ncbi:MULTISPECIES: heme ABC transporter ATP-binding protein [Corallincola]|uniref:Heme ABC transporter ATP-binding protein n=2 Tax=Corallincola TaxID=1775176 RepID=A0A368N4W8_9GAMM|nr:MULTISPECIES: heme ABC transporter ATP-binding protein [Corallincola]RCU45617.1 heme ABC transporter ATP-binding protein [Corallincola holothuriorum]TAA41746.1 heme ABC transporter ATP-binding protein [Corallincola spongiicola]
MLQLNHVRCQVAGNVLLNVDGFTASAGQMVGLLGPNGAGKSTLLKVISGDMDASGDIQLHGRALSEWPALARARHLGVLPQASQLSFPFTAQEVVALGLTPLTLSRQEGQKQVQQMMAQADCLGFADRSYPSLSGGERQRVQLARVLLQLSQAESTPLLLLDEPTSAQDLGQQHAILKLARKLAEEKGYGVMAVLHDLNQVLQYCHQGSLLVNGKIIASGAPEQLLTQQVIASHWHYQAERTVLSDGRVAML